VAEKKASQIAKEHGMSVMDLLVQLRDAGITVPAASALVDEDRVVQTLGLTTGASSAAFDFGSTKQAVAAPPALDLAPTNGSGAPAPAGNGGAVADLPRHAPPAAEPHSRTSGKAAGPRVIGADEFVPRPAPAVPLTPMRPTAPVPASAPPAASAPAAPPAPAPTAPAPSAPAAPPQAAAAPPAAPEAPAAPAATEAPATETVGSTGTHTAAPDPAKEPAAKGKKGKAAAAKDEAPSLVPSKEKPPPGSGPRILAVPEPPKRPKRDESANLPRTADGGAGAGRRRVVIDSQAARRGPGGPGGPGGGPNQPPRRQRRGRRRRGVYNDTIAPLDVEAQSSIDTVRVTSGSNVKEVAESLGVPVPDVIKKLMMLGQMATLTQTLSDDAIQIIADEFDRTVDITTVSDEDADAPAYEDDPADLLHRPPVVTIMGHVDHGKTSLLDAIRVADVVGGEAGGITQHIGAYQVHHGENVVTFLDTPGHEAFTAMRARGAKVTDIAIIVVAADDGVKPQTREAVDHALAAEVPVLVAVNKVDKEGADPTRVRTEMTTLGLQPVEWGGDIEFVDVSAKARTGLEELLETIQLVAELEDLKANPSADASGIVIESKLDPGRGPVVTMLVQRGTLKIGDAVVAGPQWGKVRALTDYHGTRTKRAVPGDPIEILGFDGVPDAGEQVRVVTNDRVARREANEREVRLKSEALARRSGRKVSLEDVFKRQGTGTKELAVIIKADVAGSMEALEDEIAKLPQDEVFVDVISSGVGGITESDVMLASASEAIIMGFNVRPVGDARSAAEREGIEIRHYSVIYKALDELRDAMTGMLDPEEVEDTVGQVEVRAIFRASKIGVIAGSYVLEGKVTRGGRVRIVRDGTVVADTTVAGLKRFNDDAREVSAGFECGITLTNYQDIKEGDVLEAYETRKVDRELA